MVYCNYSNQNSYPFILPELPFAKDAFIPHFSSETFDYHHGKHHNTYVTNLNNLLQGQQEMLKLNLEEIILTSHNQNHAIFNNAAQVWNHSFFWHSIKPQGGGTPGIIILKQIERDFASYQNFVSQFKEAAVSQFGSGWVWLIYKDKKLQIVKTANAETPITEQGEPILACDVWEHAYYIDYRNKRPDYVNVFIESMINWDFASLRLEKAVLEKAVK